MANGIDDREVIIEHERKSVGAERTFARDLPDGAELRGALAEIAAEVTRRMERSHVTGHTVAIKLRYANFHTITRQASLKTPTGDAATIARMASQLLDNVIEAGDEFRLLGIQCSRLSETGAQAQLWGDGRTTAQA
jgi:DNA polymerase-4